MKWVSNVMHIGLLGSTTHGNIGDEAILRCVASVFAAPGVHLHQIALGPTGICVNQLPLESPLTSPRYHDVQSSDAPRALNYRKLAGGWMRMAKLIRNLDVLLWAGGYAFHDRRKGVPLLMASIAACVPRKCFFGFCAVGMGPFRTALGRRAARFVLNRCDMVAVRDAASLTDLDRIGISRNVVQTVDFAHRFRPSNHVDTDQILRSSGIDSSRSFVTICPCAWLTMDDYYSYSASTTASVVDALTRVGRGMIERGHQVLVLPTMCPEDLDVAREISRQSEGAIRYIDRQLAAAEAQGIIGRGLLTVSMRMHPVVFSANTGVPCVAYAYDRKVEQLMRQLTCEELLIQRERFSADSFLAKIDGVLAAPDRWNRKTKEAGVRLTGNTEDFSSVLKRRIERKLNRGPIWRQP